MLLGIDFGTTRTVVAASDRGNYPVVNFESATGDVTEWIPSLVAERRGELRYGLEAAQVATDPGWTVLRSFKRLLSAPDVAPDTPLAVGDTCVAVADLLAGFLRAVREAALSEGSNLRGRRRRDVTLRAMIATPANAHSTQRFMTLDAFRRAGFEVQAMLNEPSAAGIEYAHRFRPTLSARREHVVVYDLGGGTFDASLVRMTDRHHDVVTTAGIPELGGDDFDVVLGRLVTDRVGLAPEALPPGAWLRLTDRCREAKEGLTPQSKRLTIDLDGVLDGPTREIAIPVSAYYEAAAPLIESTIEAMRPVMAELPDETAAGADADRPPEIAGIYLVGGGSALPAVGRTLRERYGRRVHRSPYPFAATAIGLAIAGDPAAGFQLLDRFSRYLGVFRELRDGREVTFDPILTPGMPLPRRGSPVSVRRVYRAAHNVGHFRFAECGAFHGPGAPRGDVVPFGEALFPFDPVLRHPGVDLRRVEVRRTGEDGPLIEEEYRVDVHGLVQMTVTDLDTRYYKAFRLGGGGSRSRA
jgi:molecular chaperone DnaK (HSP70)